MLERRIENSLHYPMIDKRDIHYANLLKTLRQKHQIKQSVLYLQLNLSSQQQYSDLENGKKHFTDEVVLRICEVFNVPLLDFIHGQNEFERFRLFRHDSDFKALLEAKDSEHKLLLYKKMFIETKLENVYLKLNALIPHRSDLSSLPSKHRVSVIF